MIKIVSWNLLRLVGATLDELVRVIEAEAPDLLLLQEATSMVDGLQARVGGHYARTVQPGRIHGLATWSPEAPVAPTLVVPLPSGALLHRVSQITALDGFSVANVHLSHGQVLNRRQLRRVASHLPAHAAVLGDFNLVGPVLLPGFRDVGPRRPTHLCGRVVPLRLDRCLVRGMACTHTGVLARHSSDHRPIVVRLHLADMRRSVPGSSPPALG